MVILCWETNTNHHMGIVATAAQVPSMGSSDKLGNICVYSCVCSLGFSDGLGFVRLMDEHLKAKAPDVISQSCMGEL